MSEGFGIYIHWPFCAAKCPYCDFNSHIRHDPIDQKAFARAYESELKYFATLTSGRKIDSIFFGGGTPSLMEISTVEYILEVIFKNWSVNNNAEITLEANPASVEVERFHGYRAAGINRVSLGVQSLDDRQLKRLGRLHSVDEAKRAMAQAREIFPRMSFDLIYARPGQSVEEWVRELDAAMGLAMDHLSLYQLTIERGTRFFDLYEKGRLKPPDCELSAQLYEATQHEMNAHSMPAYEISNHAFVGSESRHNLIYWRYHDYIGSGPGAHGRLSVNGIKIATACESHPEKWSQEVMCSGHGMVVNDKLTPQQASDEFLVMGLRLAEGISPERYRKIGGLSLDTENQEFLRQQGFLEMLDNGNLRATPSGFLALDSVIASLVAEYL